MNFRRTGRERTLTGCVRQALTEPVFFLRTVAGGETAAGCPGGGAGRIFPEADIILLEGMKDSDYPKFELVRGEISHKSVCRSDTLLGLVTDTELKIPGVPVFGFHETEKCTEILIKIVQTNKD